MSVKCTEEFKMFILVPVLILSCLIDFYFSKIHVSFRLRVILCDAKIIPNVIETVLSKHLSLPETAMLLNERKNFIQNLIFQSITSPTYRRKLRMFTSPKISLSNFNQSSQWKRIKDSDPTWSRFTDSSHLCLWRFSGAVILRGSGLLHACLGQSGNGTVSIAPSWVASRTFEYLWRWLPEKKPKRVKNKISWKQGILHDEVSLERVQFQGWEID